MAAVVILSLVVIGIGRTLTTFDNPAGCPPYRISIEVAMTKAFVHPAQRHGPEDYVLIGWLIAKSLSFEMIAVLTQANHFLQRHIGPSIFHFLHYKR